MAIFASALLAFSILVGGAAPPRPVFLAILELLGLVVLALTVLRLGGDGDWRRHGWALGLALAVIAVPLIQLIPLPAPLWARLPGHQEAALAPALAGATPGWAALSLTPDRTWATALGLIPALAVFAACLILDARRRFTLVVIVLIGATLSILLGALQAASGGDALHIDARTADGAMAGFFVNRNHFATLILMSLPFAAALAAANRRWPVSPRLLSWVCVLFGLLAVIALAAIRSRAGVVLLAPAMLLSLLIVARSGEAGRSIRALRLWVLGGVAAGLAVLAFGLSPLMSRFEQAGGGQERLDRWPDVLEAAGRYQPLGSGLGSFDAVYRSIEPVASLDATYFNHAHNDYLELWLETGWLGMAVLVLALIWAAPRWLKSWSNKGETRGDPLARAAGAALVLLALHSVVDFPIRSTTILVLTALCLGLIAAADPYRAAPTRKDVVTA
ncbi:MAG: O-antigen ligase family protein [Caulobacterales bacterium]|nr:O-antigen ligase family protein [Caulobacterales bacterium]